MTPLQSAFRFHLQSRIARPYGDTRPRAVIALDKARNDVSNNKIRYPAPIRGHAMRAGHDADKPDSVYVMAPESFGMRLVGTVNADKRRGIWGDSGWYADSHEDATICGVVYQLPAHDGCSRFLAAYQHSDNDSGALIDFGTVYTLEPGGTWGSAQDDAAARDAAYAADLMAQHAAASAREYDSAWQAGSQYRAELDSVTAAKAELRAILQERRLTKGTLVYPALCNAIRAQVESILETIRDARQAMHELAEGDNSAFPFYPGDKIMRAAFCEGAEINSFPE